MVENPYDRIPELAGVATYSSAARVGLSVEENVRRLVRYHWVARRLAATIIAHLTAEPVWEVKCALALHQWLLIEHVTGVRERISEMRSPAPSFTEPPDAQLNAFLEELLRSRSTSELVTGVYAIALPALAAAYRTHIEQTNPLVDHPTIRVLRAALADIDDAIAWGTATLDAIGADASWVVHLTAYLDAAGGIAGTGSRESAPVPPPRATTPFVADFHPRRDERFHGQYHFDFPPHVVYNMADVPSDERNLALLCKRTLEMDVPEMMASFMTERADEPWEFYHDYSRQLWDEARHAMMGSVALEARGIDWKGEIPLNVSFALRLNLHATPLERQTMLFAVEQSLMPGETGKRFEYETAVAAGDTLSTHFHDYDWADEVLHAQIGRRMLRRDGISGAEAAERAHVVHDKTWAALDQYRVLDAQTPWWPDFVRRALGHASAVENRENLGPINIFSE